MIDKFVNEILKLAYIAYKKDEVPVGAIVVLNNKIIGKGYNLKEKRKSIIAHAEIIAIEKACRYIRDWRLDDATLYVTLEPCNMCLEVIKQCRIKNVYYLLESKYSSEKHRNVAINKINYKNSEYKRLISDFFEKKR